MPDTEDWSELVESTEDNLALRSNPLLSARSKSSRKCLQDASETVPFVLTLRSNSDNSLVRQASLLSG